MLTEIYRAWGIYWEDNRAKIKGGEQRYERMRNESFQDLQVLFQTIQINTANAIKNAESINDLELVPIIAMTIYNQYDDDAKEEFYEECISYLTDNGEKYITSGETFESICLDEDDEDSEEWYYIYNPMFDFND